MQQAKLVGLFKPNWVSILWVVQSLSEEFHDCKIINNHDHNFEDKERNSKCISLAL